MWCETVEFQNFAYCPVSAYASELAIRCCKRICQPTAVHFDRAVGELLVRKRQFRNLKVFRSGCWCTTASTREANPRQEAFGDNSAIPRGTKYPLLFDDFLICLRGTCEFSFSHITLMSCFRSPQHVIVYPCALSVRRSVVGYSEAMYANSRTFLSPNTKFRSKKTARISLKRFNKVPQSLMSYWKQIEALSVSCAALVVNTVYLIIFVHLLERLFVTGES